MVVAWALSGLSDVWQLAINTGTTIIIFLIVFLIQNSPEFASPEAQAPVPSIETVSPQLGPQENLIFGTSSEEG